MIVEPARRQLVQLNYPIEKMSAWFWILLLSILMIVAASIGFALTSEGAWRWILIVLGILLLLISIAGLIIGGANQRASEFLATPEGQAVLKAALV